MTTRSEENYVGKCNEIPNAEKDLVYFERYRHLINSTFFVDCVSYPKIFVISF